MTYASDKLYNDIIKRMLSRLASTVKVREIVPYLTCLTLTDREEIEAKREVAGNYNAMQVLVDCLRRRENWPEQFISALKDCEQLTLASEISDAYDRIRGFNTQRPAPSAAATSGPAPATAATAATVDFPPTPELASAAVTPAPFPVPAPVTTVTTATIHNAPRTTPPLLTTSPVEPISSPAVSAPSQSPPESLLRIDSPAEALVSISALEAPAASTPKPAQPVEPTPPVSAPTAVPPSPLAAPKLTPSLQQNEVSLSPVATHSLDSSSVLTPNLIAKPSSTAANSRPTSMITTSPFQPNIPDTSFQPSPAPEESKTPLGITETSTSVKHPIQDTSPPEKVAAITQNNSSTVSQRMETAHFTVPPNSQTQATPPEMAQVSTLPSQSALESVEYFSKPCILRGEEPSYASSDDLQISRPPIETARTSPVQPARPLPVSSHLQPREQTRVPCSVTSDQLQISDATASTACSSMEQPLTVPPGNLVPNFAPEENSFSEGHLSLSENQPVEDHYDSFCQSLQREPGTMVNVVQINEEPSVLNGQPPSMMANTVYPNESQSMLNHKRPTESPPRSFTSENQPSLKTHSITQTTQKNEVHAGEPAGACPEPSTSACQVSGLNASSLSKQNEEAQRAPLQLQLGTGYIAAAVAVVAAVFMAWKLKH